MRHIYLDIPILFDTIPPHHTINQVISLELGRRITDNQIKSNLALLDTSGSMFGLFPEF